MDYEVVDDVDQWYQYYYCFGRQVGVLLGVVEGDKGVEGVVNLCIYYWGRVVGLLFGMYDGFGVGFFCCWLF